MIRLAISIYCSDMHCWNITCCRKIHNFAWCYRTDTNKDINEHNIYAQSIVASKNFNYLILILLIDDDHNATLFVIFSFLLGLLENDLEQLIRVIIYIIKSRTIFFLRFCYVVIFIFREYCSYLVYQCWRSRRC